MLMCLCYTIELFTKCCVIPLKSLPVQNSGPPLTHCSPTQEAQRMFVMKNNEMMFFI